MNALPSPIAPPQPTQVRQPKKRIVNVASRRLHHRLALEATTKLAIYSLLSTLGVGALANLIHYNWSQQSKLHYLQSTLKTTQHRTERGNRDFIRSFDGQVTKSVMEENSYKVPADRLPIAIVDPAKPETSNLTDRDDSQN
jgi:hypothetical protein